MYFGESVQYVEDKFGKSIENEINRFDESTKRVLYKERFSIKTRIIDEIYQFYKDKYNFKIPHKYFSMYFICNKISVYTINDNINLSVNCEWEDGKFKSYLKSSKNISDFNFTAEVVITRRKISKTSNKEIITVYCRRIHR